MNSNPNRQPPGIPSGGQFAPDPWAANAAPIALDGDTERWPESGAELETLVTSGLDRDWAEEATVTRTVLARMTEHESVGVVELERPGATMQVIMRHDSHAPVRVETEVMIRSDVPGKFQDDLFVATQRAQTTTVEASRLKRAPDIIRQAIDKDRLQHRLNDRLVWPGLSEAKAQHTHGPHPFLTRPVHVECVEGLEPGGAPVFRFSPFDVSDPDLGAPITLVTRRTKAGKLAISRVFVGDDTAGLSDTDERLTLAQAWAKAEAWSYGKQPASVETSQDVTEQERRMMVVLGDIVDAHARSGR